METFLFGPIYLTHYDNASVSEMVVSMVTMRYSTPLVIAELALHAITIVSLTLFLVIIMPFGLFHANLRIITLQTAISGWVVIVARVTDIAYRQFVCESDWCRGFLFVTTSVYAFGLLSCFGSLFAVVIERSFATLLVEDYEKKPRRYISVLTFGVIYVANAVALLLTFCDQTLPLAVLFLVLILMLYFIFRYLLRVNQHRYFHSQCSSALSVRFQIAENIRVLQIFHSLYVASSVVCATALGFIIAMHFTTGTQAAHLTTIIFGLNLIFGMSSVLIPVLWMWHFPQLRRHGRRRLWALLGTTISRRFLNTRIGEDAESPARAVAEETSTGAWFVAANNEDLRETTNSASRPKRSRPTMRATAIFDANGNHQKSRASQTKQDHLKTIDGRAMVLNNDAATRHYFEHYQKMWN